MSDTTRTTISLPKRLYAKAVERQKALHMATFSDYLQHLLRLRFMKSEMEAESAAVLDLPEKAARPHLKN